MSIYHVEVLQVDCELKAYVVIQNDWTGSLTGSLRKIYLDGNTYYCRADGQRVNVTKQRAEYLMLQDKIKTALEWYRQTKF